MNTAQVRPIAMLPSFVVATIQQADPMFFNPKQVVFFPRNRAVSRLSLFSDPTPNHSMNQFQERIAPEQLGMLQPVGSTVAFNSNESLYTFFQNLLPLHLVEQAYATVFELNTLSNRTKTRPVTVIGQGLYGEALIRFLWAKGYTHLFQLLAPAKQKDLFTLLPRTSAALLRYEDNPDVQFFSAAKAQTICKQQHRTFRFNATTPLPNLVDTVGEVFCVTPDSLPIEVQALEHLQWPSGTQHLLGTESLAKLDLSEQAMMTLSSDRFVSHPSTGYYVEPALTFLVEHAHLFKDLKASSAQQEELLQSIAAYCADLSPQTSLLDQPTLSLSDLKTLTVSDCFALEDEFWITTRF